MSYAPARPFRCPRYPAPCYGPGDRGERLATLGSDGRWKSEDGSKNPGTCDFKDVFEFVELLPLSLRFPLKIRKYVVSE